MNLCDIKTVKNIMQAYGLHFRKEFGQNFLTNKMVVEDIAASCTDKADGTIVEIGPGLGTLTRELSSAHREVVAFERSIASPSRLAASEKEHDAGSGSTMKYAVFPSRDVPSVPSA